MEQVKKYDITEITIRLNNLRKRFGDYYVDNAIRLCETYSDNRCDVLNLAYRNLKNRLIKIQRHKYGYVRNIEYEKKLRKNPYSIYYNCIDYSSLYPSSSSSTWTITASSLGTYGIH